MTAMTSAQRLDAVLENRLPDRVPLLLPVVLQGARELGMTQRAYFDDPEAVAEGQVRLQRRYGHDALFGAFYANQEAEAWGGQTLFREDGPPNGGAPVLRRPEAIDSLQAPRVEDCPTLVRVLASIRHMKARVGDDIPILGSVIAPFSLPVLQMGFEGYLVLMHEDRPRFQRLMQVNEEFAVAWGHAQLDAGASALAYVDPVSSPTIVPRDLYLETGFPVACRTIARIGGTLAANFASGRCLPILDDVVASGVKAVVASADEDLATLKSRCAGRIAVVGNLNGIEMRRWTPEEADRQVRAAIAAAGPGGGFVLADNHGEIPLQVPDEVLSAISEAVQRHGRYPLSCE